MKYREILDAAIRAPSGDNCQPWRFEVEGNRIFLYNKPNEDKSLYNFLQQASHVAHGAAIENLVLAASANGLSVNVQVFPSSDDSSLVAILDLIEANIQQDPLYPYIRSRTTNRRKYRQGTLSADEKSALRSADNTGEGSIFLVDKDVQKQSLASVIGLNDQLVFENQYLHAFLFEHIRWSDTEASETGDGLDIKTLELTTIDSMAFRVFRNFNLLQKFNRLGLSRIVAMNAEKLARSAAAIGAIVVPGNQPYDYVAAGRCLQRVWLQATKLGLSFQLMTGIPLLMQRVLRGSVEQLSEKHVELIRMAYETSKNQFGVSDGNLALMFRVGGANPPSQRSLRRPVEDFVSRFRSSDKRA